MKKGDKLFVRIDSKNPGLDFTPEDFENHVNYLKAVASERYFIGGGFNNTRGGMVLFKAKDMDEAKEISEKDPLIEKKFFTFELYEWELFILSES